MLDERRKRFLRNVDIKSIRPNGILWIWGEHVRTVQLTKEDIRYLRWYHHNPNIAYEVDVRISLQNYKIAEDKNKYNKNCRTKRKIKNKGFKQKLIVGSLLVTVIVGSCLYNNQYAVNKSVNEVENQVTYFSNEEYVSSEVNLDYETSRESTIKHLCDIYQVDFNKTYDKLRELTNDFNSRDYYNGCIKGVTCKGYDVVAASEEELLTYAIRAIKQVPERFGLDESIHIHNGYSSGEDYFNQISNVCGVLGLDRNLMYAIVRTETGFNSELFNTINNPAGLIGVNGTDPWWVFENKEEGFLELGMELIKYYRSIGVDPMVVDSETIEKIGAIHAPVSDNNENWVPVVLECLDYARNNEAELFGGEEIHGLRR